MLGPGHRQTAEDGDKDPLKLSDEKTGLRDQFLFSKTDSVGPVAQFCLARRQWNPRGIGARKDT